MHRLGFKVVCIHALVGSGWSAKGHFHVFDLDSHEHFHVVWIVHLGDVSILFVQPMLWTFYVICQVYFVDVPTLL